MQKSITKLYLGFSDEIKVATIAINIIGSLSNDEGTARRREKEARGLLGCVRLGNLDLDFKIRISDLQSNAKSENGFQR